MADRVLLVTADEGLARAAASLQATGAELAHARDGATGVEMVERARPDVVVWDGDLPGSDGGDAPVARVRATGAGMVMIVAGLPAGIRALRDGVEQLLIRPVDPDLLAAAVARAAEAGRWRRAANEGARGRRPRTLAEVEREQIELALRHHAGNRTRAARELGISRATLINKIKAYALDL